MTDKYLVRFGESVEYTTADKHLIDSMTENLHRDLKEIFPSLPADALPHPEVETITDPARYGAYQELHSDVYPRILHMLRKEIAVRMSIGELNVNAPWSNVDPDAK